MKRSPFCQGVYRSSCLGDTAHALRNGAADLPPIQVIKTKGGNMVTLDNRRLLTYRAAGRQVPYKIVSQNDPDVQRQMKKKLNFPEGHENPFINFSSGFNFFNF